ncbi:MAG: NAD(P)-dependent oxidoreductase [Mogibacterium sp.]|nr:NAD(P)-dependent oxidoreductase [Mogibacterium sp.]
MKIAVTGAGGFIGTEVLASLSGVRDVETIALSRRADGVDNDLPRCELRTTDWSYESLAESLRGADCVIHLAGTRGTAPDPELYSINERMTRTLLDAMKAAGTGRIVFASSVSVYDDESLIPWTEDSPLHGRTAYGDSKIRCEELIRGCSGRYGYSYAIARIAQVLGSGERRPGMMNAFIDAAMEKGTLHVMGESRAKRQYIYVRDLANILVYLSTGRNKVKNDSSITVNAGMRRAYTNIEIARMVNSAFGNDTPIDYDDSYPETIRGFHMDISRLRDVLDYEPVDMEEALRDLRKGIKA